MIATEKQNFDQINYSLNDPEKQKELLMQDEEEDFLDEGIYEKFIHIFVYLILILVGW